MVELLGRYSNRTDWASRAAQAGQLRQPGRRVVPPTRGIVRRLSDEQVSMLVKRYLEGSTMTALADLFEIHRTTVSLHLKRQGVRSRRSS